MAALTNDTSKNTIQSRTRIYLLSKWSVKWKPINHMLLWWFCAIFRIVLQRSSNFFLIFLKNPWTNALNEIRFFIFLSFIFHCNLPCPLDSLSLQICASIFRWTAKKNSTDLTWGKMCFHVRTSFRLGLALFCWSVVVLLSDC